MTTPFKNPINKFAPVFLMMVTMFLFGFGCNTSKPTPNPLAGFHEIDRKELNSNKVLSIDYKDYIQKLPPKQNGYIGTVFIYENETGQHAVCIEIFEGNKNASWQHVLFYDKEDKRIKAIRYGHVKYQS
jgi:hypothetical protein